MQPPNYVQYPRYRQADISISLIGDAWDYIKNNMSVYVGFTAIVLLGGSILSAIVQFPDQMAAISAPARLEDPLWQIKSPLYWLSQFISSLTQWLFIAGIANIALKELGGQKAELGDGFAIFKSGFGSVVLAGILSSIAIFIGIMLCIVPGVVLAVLFFCVYPAILDQKLSPIDGLTWSLQNVKNHFWPCLGVMLLGALASGLGIVACCIGIIFTAPLYPVLATMVYHQLRWEETGGTADLAHPVPNPYDQPATPPSHMPTPSEMAPPSSYPSTSVEEAPRDPDSDSRS